MKKVVFITTHREFVAGDRASFEDDVAAAHVAAGRAEYASAGVREFAPVTPEGRLAEGAKASVVEGIMKK